MSSVIGMNEVKERLIKELVFPLQQKKTLKMMKIQPNNILMFGPSGTGKSFVVKAFMSGIRNSVGFLEVRPSDIKGGYVGQSEKCVVDLFTTARKVAAEMGMCVLFIDEVDTFAKKRDFSGKDTSADLANAFLTQLEGVSADNDNLVVIAATNAIPEELDNAFLSRIAIEIFVDLPNRFDIKNLLSKMWNVETPCSAEELRISFDDATFDQLCAKMEQKGYSNREITKIGTFALMETVSELFFGKVYKLNASNKYYSLQSAQAIDATLAQFTEENNLPPNADICPRKIEVRDVEKAMSVIKPHNTEKELQKFAPFKYSNQAIIADEKEKALNSASGASGATGDADILNVPDIADIPADIPDDAPLILPPGEMDKIIPMGVSNCVDVEQGYTCCVDEAASKPNKKKWRCSTKV
jgi:SpoVK/Ycf46/Vps4 family AAA+-type ATPase